MSTVLVLVLGVSVIWRDATWDAPPPAAAGPAPATDGVVLQAVLTPQPDPFTPSAGTDQAGVIPLDTGGGTLPADGPGVYAATTEPPACDRERLIASLTSDPQVAEAWSGVRDIRPDEIPAYIRELTPAILRSDTFVTDHGYLNGGATVVPAVLQRGTAVLVDRFGLPVVKCSCGDPLTPPIRYSGDPSVQGRVWPGFTRDTIVVIQQSSVVIDQFVMADVVQGSPVVVVPGTVDVRPAPPGTALRLVVAHEDPWWTARRLSYAPPGTGWPGTSTTAEPAPGRASVEPGPAPHVVPPAAPQAVPQVVPRTASRTVRDATTNRTTAPAGVSPRRRATESPDRPPGTVARRPRPATTTQPPSAFVPAPPSAVPTRPPRGNTSPGPSPTAATDPSTTTDRTTTTGRTTTAERSAASPTSTAPTTNPPVTTTRQLTEAPTAGAPGTG
ncbi:DUF6777 domain-containing protein [Pseudonocardia bannensis]|uniref:DUF6777 domain-containing protein n=1 Tax=Pseudonocardia bannensis TaxID=630973 RepID=UPI001B7CE810|nr:DUF6777 domain-containing protein [Pseudonocardia bannensis]